MSSLLERIDRFEHDLAPMESELPRPPRRALLLVGGFFVQRLGERQPAGA